MDFEGSPNTKLKTLFEKHTVSFSKSIKFLYKIKLRYVKILPKKKIPLIIEL